MSLVAVLNLVTSSLFGGKFGGFPALNAEALTFPLIETKELGLNHKQQPQVKYSLSVSPHCAQQLVRQQ